MSVETEPIVRPPTVGSNEPSAPGEVSEPTDPLLSLHPVHNNNSTLPPSAPAPSAPSAQPYPSAPYPESGK